MDELAKAANKNDTICGSVKANIPFCGCEALLSPSANQDTAKSATPSQVITSSPDLVPLPFSIAPLSGGATHAPIVSLLPIPYYAPSAPSDVVTSAQSVVSSIAPSDVVTSAPIVVVTPAQGIVSTFAPIVVFTPAQGIVTTFAPIVVVTSAPIVVVTSAQGIVTTFAPIVVVTSAPSVVSTSV